VIKLAKILYPTDFSELSLAALKYALSFARQFDAQLHCLNVVDESYQYWLAMGPEGVPIGPDTGLMIKTAKEQMDQFVKDHLSELPKVVTKVITGRPFVEIVRYARQQAIDLIVIATHGRSGFKHVLMGSVAERVVRKAPCPVLTCRSPEHEFVMP
jgi:nucleotide-binding universal stress UspA family protein